GRIGLGPESIDSFETLRTEMTCSVSQFGDVSPGAASVMMIHRQRPTRPPQGRQCLQGDRFSSLFAAKAEAFRFKSVVRIQKNEITISQFSPAAREPLLSKRLGFLGGPCGRNYFREVDRARQQVGVLKSRNLSRAECHHLFQRVEEVWIEMLPFRGRMEIGDVP